MSFVPNCDLKRLDPMSNDYDFISDIERKKLECYHIKVGPVAHLVERIVRNDEAESSILFRSTI